MITAAFPFDEEKAIQILGDSDFKISDEGIQKAYGSTPTSELAATVRRLIKEVRS